MVLVLAFNFGCYKVDVASQKQTTPMGLFVLLVEAVKIGLDFRGGIKIIHRINISLLACFALSALMVAIDTELQKSKCKKISSIVPTQPLS